MVKRCALVVASTLVSAGLLSIADTPPSSAGGGSTDWKQIDVGGVHSCGINDGGSLFCWGNDANGQLGNGAPCCNSSSPVAVTAATNWKQVDAGGDHTCAVKNSGRLFCWGDDDNGQLGNGDPFSDSNVPVQVGSATNWKRVALGGNHTCAIRTNRRLFCWGDDGSGQVGDGAPNADVSAPTQVSGAGTDWTLVAGGGVHTCATRTTSRLFCWGNDSSGQIGDGTVGGPTAPSPAEVTGAATNWAKITTGDAHSCATKRSGRLFCWGDDNFGALGDGTAGADSATPTQVSGSATNWKLVSGGQASTCATKTTGRAFCWGNDMQGRLGNGAAGATASPDQLDGATTDWKKISVGATHACARNSGRRLFCWGNDTSGQVGDGAVAGGDEPSPQEVVAHP
jgi:alpha-tubulin suppressor-like RCC1 family protein